MPFQGAGARIDVLKQALRERSLSGSAESWILAGGIANKILLLRPGASEISRLGSRFLSRHGEHISALLHEYRELDDQLTGVARPQPTVEAFNQACDGEADRIDDLLRRLKVLVACIVVSRPATTPLNDAITLLSFASPRQASIRNRNKEEQDSLLLAFGISLMIAFVFFASSPFFRPLLPEAIQRGWPTMTDYSRNLLGWFVTDQLRYPIVAFIALWFRQRQIIDGKWFVENTYRVREIKYFKLLVFALLVGVVVDLVFRLINFYVINSSSDPIGTCIQNYFMSLWLSSPVLALLVVVIARIFDLMYVGQSRKLDRMMLLATPLFMALVVQNGVNCYINNGTDALYGALASYVTAAIVFYLLLMTALRLRSTPTGGAVL